MFIVELYREIGGWAPLLGATFDNKHDAIEYALRYRAGCAEKNVKPMPCRVMAMRCEYEWASDAPIGA